MKEALAEIDLVRRRDRGLVPAILFKGVDGADVDDVEREWRPFLDEHVPADVDALERAVHNAEDIGWNWSAIVGVDADALVYDLYSIQAQGHVQGVMKVRKVGFSQHPDHPGAAMVVVESLASAPWNRRLLVDAPIFAGCGYYLFARAVELSFEEELGGCVGLRSPRGSTPFYRDRLGMTDLGPDPADPAMTLFELSTTQAHAFMQDLQGLRAPS